ncbi:hypothetical protein MKX01_002082, partial [Papaver californicum]
MDHKYCLQKYVTRNAVKAWNNDESGKLVIGKEEYEIESELVKKSLSLSITGNKIIKPRNENQVPSFIEQSFPQMPRDSKKFHSHVIDIFRSDDELEVAKL